ncbi:MAG: hypothetical protein HIU87_07585 [Acidobacteria bacterium]|nr:hypothetical protein [Acidobacteriota bacterium]
MRNERQPAAGRMQLDMMRAAADDSDNVVHSPCIENAVMFLLSGNV